MDDREIRLKRMKDYMDSTHDQFIRNLELSKTFNLHEHNVLAGPTKKIKKKHK